MQEMQWAQISEEVIKFKFTDISVPCLIFVISSALSLYLLYLQFNVTFPHLYNAIRWDSSKIDTFRGTKKYKFDLNLIMKTPY